MVTIPKDEYDDLIANLAFVQAFVRYANGTEYISKKMCSIFFPNIQVKEDEN